MNLFKRYPKASINLIYISSSECFSVRSLQYHWCIRNCAFYKNVPFLGYVRLTVFIALHEQFKGIDLLIYKLFFLQLEIRIVNGWNLFVSRNGQYKTLVSILILKDVSKKQSPWGRILLRTKKENPLLLFDFIPLQITLKNESKSA